jgi:hypothetical protein
MFRQTPGIAIMVRAVLVLVGCCCAALPGCQSTPVQTATPPPPPPHTIALFSEIEPKRDAIKEAVLRRLPPGTPMVEAQQVLQAQGFTWRPYNEITQFFTPSQLVPNGVALRPEAYRSIQAARQDGPVYCRATLPDLAEWHPNTYVVLLVLIPDEAQSLRDVEVGIRPEWNLQAGYFKRHSDLREPIGLTVEAARAQMEAAGFRCTAVVPKPDAKDARSHLLCETFDENIIGGQIVRVRLFPDAMGVIRETDVQNRDELFDAERCMLPHGDESVGVAICRSVLFPVRAGCRYTLFTIAVCMAITAMPYGLH